MFFPLMAFQKKKHIYIYLLPINLINPTSQSMQLLARQTKALLFCFIFQSNLRSHKCGKPTALKITVYQKLCYVYKLCLRLLVFYPQIKRFTT